MTLPKSILAQFDSVSKPQPNRPRPIVGSHCLTLDFQKSKWILIGVPDDRGIQNNYGRVGAKDGPKAFREIFFAHSIASISPGQHSIYDLGNLKLSNNLRETLQRLKTVVDEIKTLAPKKKILIIGGGHDIAYGEIAGCIASPAMAKKHHIINIDAHSDVRPLEKGNVITSGTPFYRLIEEEGIDPENYHPFGVQQASNNAQLVEWMKKKKISAKWLEKMPTSDQQISQFNGLMKKMKNKPWHLSIDLDGFPMSIAPGVSAPAVMGVTPDIFLGLDKVDSFSSLQSLGIYELAPKYDVNNFTARLAAKLAYLVLSHA
jgi:formiminoglutamase